MLQRSNQREGAIVCANMVAKLVTHTKKNERHMDFESFEKAASALYRAYIRHKKDYDIGAGYSST